MTTAIVSSNRIPSALSTSQCLRDSRTCPRSYRRECGNARPNPKHSQIAFQSDRDGMGEIFVMNSDGTNQTNVTNNPAADGWPCWSPDGTKIAFVSSRDGDMEIYVVNADESGLMKLTDNSAWDGGPT